MAHLDTVLAQSGCEPDATGAVTSGIHLATTFEREPDLSYASGFIYGRDNNPTRAQLEAVFAKVEGGAHGAAFASGMAGINAVMQAVPKGHVILPADVYHGTRHLLMDSFTDWGLAMSTVDARDPDDVDAKLAAAAASGASPVLLFLESPSNPMLNVCSIVALGDAAHRHGALLVVDNTWATPVLTRPLTMGADLVLHSTTKYAGGHSDMTGGMVVGPATGPGLALFQRIRKLQKAAGAHAAPFDAWLCMRGLRTLSVRVKAACATAAAVADFLHAHPKVATVLYPGLESHPGHAIAKAEMGGTFYGAMLSFLVDGSPADAVRVAGSLKVWRRATSLGGTESLVEHRRSVEGPRSSTPGNLLRLSVGLEDAGDLIEDLRVALEA